MDNVYCDILNHWYWLRNSSIHLQLTSQKVTSTFISFFFHL